jgi:hypothetical protein
MATANEEIRDALIRHQIGLTRLSSGGVMEILALLQAVEDDLITRISRLSDTPTRRRLDEALQSIKVLISEAYSGVYPALENLLSSVAEKEAGYIAGVMRSAIPVAVDVIVPATAQLIAGVVSKPFQGRLLSEWAQDLETASFAKVRDTIRIGYAQGQTTAQIVQLIRGTRRANYADGALEITRRNAASVVRTAIANTAADARDILYAENSNLISGIIWDSTLDGRTTLICQARDGKKYTIDGKPIGHSLPYLGGPGRAHWGCRSHAVPIVKSWRELGIDEDDAPPSTRSSLNGQVPAETTYPEWLKSQSVEFVEDVLGKERARLFLSGEIALEKFIDRQGRTLTLSQLYEKI